MSRMVELFARFRDDEDGAALVEYTILIGIIAVAVITAITVVGGWMTGEWGKLTGALGLGEGDGGNPDPDPDTQPGN